MSSEYYQFPVDSLLSSSIFGNNSSRTTNHTLKDLVQKPLKLLLYTNESSRPSDEINSIRMNVNQVTFAVLISILLVADLLLVYSLRHLVLHYERKGRDILRPFRRRLREKQAQMKRMLAVKS